MRQGLMSDEDGSKWWFLNNLLHRKDGPAVECAGGNKEWWINGMLHREDGPAIEYTNGEKFWYLNGERINCSTQEEFERLLKLKAFW